MGRNTNHQPLYDEPIIILLYLEHTEILRFCKGIGISIYVIAYHACIDDTHSNTAHSCSE
jgi:hypothetical protein